MNFTPGLHHQPQHNSDRRHHALRLHCGRLARAARPHRRRLADRLREYRGRPEPLPIVSDGQGGRRVDQGLEYSLLEDPDK